MSNLKKYLNDLLVFYTEYFEHPYLQILLERYAYSEISGTSILI